MFYINWDKVIYHLITFIFDDILYYIYDVSFYNNKYIILTINNTDDQLKKHTDKNVLFELDNKK